MTGFIPFLSSIKILNPGEHLNSHVYNLILYLFLMNLMNIMNLVYWHFTVNLGD